MRCGAWYSMMDAKLLKSAIARIQKVVNQCCDGSEMYKKSYSVCEDSIMTLISCCELLSKHAHFSFDWNNVRNQFIESKNELDSFKVANRHKQQDEEKNQLIKKIAELEQRLQDASATRDQHVNATCTKSDMFQMWRKTLSELPNNCILYPQVNMCANLLKFWMGSTFNQNRKLKYGFKLSNMREWVLDIVIGFGLHMNDTYTMNQYFNNFKYWCSENRTYIVPGEEYRYTHKVPESAILSRTVVLWDILYDSGLNVLDSLPEKYRVSRDMMYEKLNANQVDNNDRLKNYKDYKQFPEILREFNIVKLEELNYATN